MPLRTKIEPKDAHVLVVEDNFNNYRLITRLLTLLDVPQCEWKTSGSQVVEFADALPRVDLILMDIHLPVEDGYQALAKLREHPKFADTCIIAVTAEATDANLRRARAEGFDGFIGKPISPALFPEQMKKVFQGEEVWEL